MIEQHPPMPRTGEVATRLTAEERDDVFARMLETKLEQGYTIESREGTRAVLATRGPRRLFRIRRDAATARELVEIDELGKFTSRKQS
jgi:hypothetical protein